MPVAELTQSDIKYQVGELLVGRGVSSQVALVKDSFRTWSSVQPGTLVWMEDRYNLPSHPVYDKDVAKRINEDQTSPMLRMMRMQHEDGRETSRNV